MTATAMTTSINPNPKHSDVISVRINAITVEDRHRKEMGDLDKLAESLSLMGLLQPIGIDPNYRLVFGERRLRAAQKLGWSEIPARIVHVPAIVLGELTENEVRKDFTVSERVAIAQAVEEYLGNRQGQRTDRELPPNLAEVRGKETREMSAEKAGFKRETYRHARKVVEAAAPELTDAMDREELSVSAAAALADLPEPERKPVWDKAKELGPKVTAASIKDARKELTTPKVVKLDNPLFTAQDRAVFSPLVRMIDEMSRYMGNRSPQQAAADFHAAYPWQSEQFRNPMMAQLPTVCEFINALLNGVPDEKAE